ncbi:MAG: glutamate--tRNA ligase, partial [Ruminococcus sp.]|nr:glutamate--tRNA ligase [Ruminococcus sp.]
DEYEKKALPILSELCEDYINIKKLASLLHTRIAYFGEIESFIGFVTSRLDMDSSLYANKKNKTTPENCKEILEDCLPLLESVERWDNDTLFTVLKDYASSREKNAGAVMWAVRIAVSRQAVTPGGATELMEVFGRTESIERIKQAINELA